MRGTDARTYSMPTPSRARPQTVSAAWRVKLGRATRPQKRKFSQWKLDGRGYRGADVAPFPSAVICNNRLGDDE